MQLVKKHGKEHVYLDSKGEFIDLREVLTDLGQDGSGKIIQFDEIERDF